METTTIGAAAARSEGSICSANSSQSMMHSSSILTMQVDAMELHPSFRAAELRVAEIIQQLVQDVETRISDSLRQAAGDVALHLSKEAAAKVVAAERKVLYLEQELINAKEQALSMLLRLKNFTDSQINDLEKQVAAERRRAEEAEAKFTSLQDSLKQVKKPSRTKRGQKTEDDCLALIAGVACEVTHTDDNGCKDSENDKECSSMSEKHRDKANNEGDGPESSFTQNDSNVDNKTREQDCGTADEHNSDGGDDEEDDDQVSEDNNGGGSSFAAAETKQTFSPRRLRKRKNRHVYTSELTKLMAGSKRARGKSSRPHRDMRKVATGALLESSRDSRRLMQGARQLFSLAERKW